MTVQQPAITWKGAHPKNYTLLRGGVKPEAVVLHIMEGTLAGCDAWFANPASGVSAHFGVGEQGTIHNYVNLGDTAHANGIIEPGYTAKLIDDNPGINPNRWTVSIEFEGHSGQTLAPKQYAAGVQLVAWLFDAHLLTGGASGVAVDRDHVLMHRDITPSMRARCPGWPESYQQAFIDAVSETLNPAQIDPLRDVLDGLTLIQQGNRAARDEMNLRFSQVVEDMNRRFDLMDEAISRTINKYRT